jgi:hypothetical protein
MTEADKKELFRLLVRVRDDFGGIQRLVGKLPDNKGRERQLHDLLEATNSFERELFKELHGSNG